MSEGIDKEAREREAANFLKQNYTWDKSGRGYIRKSDGMLEFLPATMAAFAQSCVERPARFDCPNCRHPLVSDQGMPVCLMCRHRMCYQVMEFISDDEAKKIEAEPPVDRAVGERTREDRNG